jgi:Protein of unknown function (DUF2905)
MPSTELGKLLVIIGVAAIVVGVILWLGGGRIPLGRLPGDIAITRQGGSFHFPIVTCLLLSVLFSAILWLFRR